MLQPSLPTASLDLVTLTILTIRMPSLLPLVTLLILTLDFRVLDTLTLHSQDLKSLFLDTLDHLYTPDLDTLHLDALDLGILVLDLGILVLDTHTTAMDSVDTQDTATENTIHHTLSRHFF